MATQIEIAKHLDLSDRQVRNLLSDGVLPGSKGRGGFDMDACREAYIRYLRGLGSSQVKAETNPGEEGIDPLVEYKLLEERRGLTAAQRISAEMKNEVDAKRLIPATFFTFAFAKFIPAAGSIFDTVIMTLRRRHPDLTPGQLDSINRELTKARNIIAQAAERLPEWHDEFIDQST